MVYKQFNIIIIMNEVNKKLMNLFFLSFLRETDRDAGFLEEQTYVELNEILDLFRSQGLVEERNFLLTDAIDSLFEDFEKKYTDEYNAKYPDKENPDEPYEPYENWIDPNISLMKFLSEYK